MPLVGLARLERATSTFAQSRSYSIELQARIHVAVGGSSEQCLLLLPSAYYLFGGGDRS